MANFHTVEQGEHLSTLAIKYGFYDWRTIYNDPKNAKFRKKRPNPNILCPGDQIYIPDKAPKSVERVTDTTHFFKVPPQTITIRVVLKEQIERKTLGSQDCVLKFGDVVRKCKTDKSGLLVQKVPIDTETVELSVTNIGLKWILKVGHLDPTHQVTEDECIMTGIQARLNNLCYHCGEVDGIAGPRTKQALQDFQRHVMGRDDADGELDADTREALEREHAC
jgi:hypothetical protein